MGPGQHLLKSPTREQFTATVPCSWRGQQGLLQAGFHKLFPMLPGGGLRVTPHLHSRLLLAPSPGGPWRCEGHSPPQLSLPPQAQGPSTGCSWMASSCGSGPAAVGTLPHWLTVLVLKLSPLPPENLGPGVWSLPETVPGLAAEPHPHSSHSAKQSLEELSMEETQLWL